jgi:hypothetical protein
MNEELRQPEVLTELGKCAFSGMNWAALKKHVNRKFGIETSVPTLKRVFNTYLERRAEIIASNKEIQTEMKGEIDKTIINTRSALEKIHKYVDELMEYSRHRDDRLGLECAKEILNQLYFQEKLINKLTTGVNIEQMNKIETIQIMVNKLDSLEKEGRIKIIDTSLKGD